MFVKTSSSAVGAAAAGSDISIALMRYVDLILITPEVMLHGCSDLIT